MSFSKLWFVAFCALSALLLVSGSAVASDTREELYDIAKPFTPGATIVSDLSAHGLLGEYQLGVVGGFILQHLAKEALGGLGITFRG